MAKTSGDWVIGRLGHWVIGRSGDESLGDWVIESLGDWANESLNQRISINLKLDSMIQSPNHPITQ